VVRAPHGSLNDRRWLPVVEDLYGWHCRNERYLRNERPLAYVGMVYSQQTARFYGGQQSRQKVEDHTLGYYQALIEARIPFEMVHDRLLVREAGKDRVVYFPWDIDRTFWELLSVDHGKLLRNAVEWAANWPPPVTVTGPGVLDVTIWKQASSLTVHLVNLTNPMMMKGPLREFIPAPPQKVSIRLAAGTKVKKVQLQVSGVTPRVEEASGSITLTIPSILEHEVIAIDL
jgi:hypothetical protein